jgi:hypothetical protein
LTQTCAWHTLQTESSQIARDKQKTARAALRNLETAEATSLWLKMETAVLGSEITLYSNSEYW